VSDDLDSEIGDHLRNLSLPPAPSGLRRYLNGLPSDVQRSRLPFLGRRRYVIAIAAALVLLSLAAGSVLVPGSAPAPTSPVGTQPEVTANPNVRAFRAPGIGFEYPKAWVDQSSAFASTTPGRRLVALLTLGLPRCPATSVTLVGPTQVPIPCNPIAAAPGTGRLFVTEEMDQLPGLHFPGTLVTIAGYRVWQRGVSSVAGQPTSVQWAIESPDRGIYHFSAEFPLADLAPRQAELEAMLASLRLSAWEPPPPVFDEHVHLELGSFSFDYPAGWTVYYPTDFSMVDVAVVTIASTPVLPPCPSSCRGFTSPPGSIVIEFRIGGGVSAPDWTKATATVGGQPAFRGDWGAENATGDEGHSWEVRLGGRGGRATLGIEASLRGPNLPELRTEMDEVLASVRITPVASPAP
jgi:hypothetical protein